MFYGTYRLMMDRFSPDHPVQSMDTNRHNSAASASRRRARRALLGMSDRSLADLGFSRERLIQGVKAWPWRIEPETTSESAGLASVVASDIHHPNFVSPQHPETLDQRQAA